MFVDHVGHCAPSQVDVWESWQLVVICWFSLSEIFIVALIVSIKKIYDQLE